MASAGQPADLSRIRVNCAYCSLSELCLPHGLGPDELNILESITKHSKPMHRGTYLFRDGDPFISLYAVRSGSVKLYKLADNGDDHIIGFYFPGEVLGFDAIEKNRHVCSAITMETSTYCSFPFNRLENICSKLPGLQHHIFSLMSRELSGEHELLLSLADKTAEERVATFLISLSQRFKRIGYSPQAFKLAMSRQDIGNYLGLTTETVSRILARLQREYIIATERKNIEIKDLDRLHDLCTSHMKNSKCAGDSA